MINDVVRIKNSFSARSSSQNTLDEITITVSKSPNKCLKFWKMMNNLVTNSLVIVAIFVSHICFDLLCINDPMTQKEC